ncbi:hypothetical protein GCM10008931_43630 [Oceanobacillus oncorhynchi subsp. oncorhynchi]|uniref:hypothetical protein n=1 Tax=Oceanobacillus oncorhynchi TaxID=545501 RepID=UPI0031DE140C
MTKLNIFEVAAKNKMRFPFRGVASVEDLYDLGITDLDSIFKTLNSQLKQVKEESLLDSKTKEDKELDVKIEIVKHIFNEKVKEKEDKEKEHEKKVQKQKILNVLSSKQDAELEDKSPEELQAMLKDL